jgi:hypothetical protein
VHLDALTGNKAARHDPTQQSIAVLDHRDHLNEEAS